MMNLAHRNPPSRVEADDITEEEIVERIFEAIVEQRLPPGAKLAEAALCTAFGVGRMRIRRALLLLAAQEIVELQANRGAFVASPTPEQANEIFEARLAIEPTIARLAVQRASEAEIGALCRHIELEHEAHRDGRRRDAIRLSGQFHSLLAQVAGNSVMLRTMKELIPRTSLIIGIFGAPGLANCRSDDHTAILKAIEGRDAELAAATMERHLKHIQEHLDLTGNPAGPLDLATIFKR
jgi:DNA-binding GntR family transcriptional regulator